MTLCIGGPLHGRQAPLEFEDTLSFRYEKWPDVEIGEGEPVAMAPDAAVAHATYRRQPIDIFIGGSSLGAYVYVCTTKHLTGREIAARIISLLNTGRLT